MNIDLNDEAREYGEVASRALESAGGDLLVQRAEATPEERDAVTGVLGELGAWDLDPRGSEDELEAAAAVCRAAGWWAVPYPVAERIARPRDIEADGLVVVDERRPAARIGGLGGEWVAVGLDGRRSRARAQASDVSPRKSAFVADLALEPLDDAGAADVALGLVLPCWTLLGMLDRAVALAGDYVQEREQFGQALARFQGVQFQLTDAEVERVGVEQLAKYALWSVQVGRPEAVDDALALRVAALDAAEVVFRVSHQLHGAIGFCDETTLSWLSRHAQPLRRLPFGPSGTLAALTRTIGRRGLTGIFSEGAAR